MDAAPAGPDDAAAPPPGSRPRRAAALRAAAAADSEHGADDTAAALALARSARSLVIFTGSGVSASAGMSTFSDPGGLYDRARRRFGLDSGVRLFHGSFFVSRRNDCCAFLADVCAEAAAARPTRAHHALEALAANGRLLRHVTMNVDGLHRALPALQARTLEMHGCARDTVCERCARSAPLAAPQLRAFRAAAARGAPPPRCALPDAAAAAAEGGAARGARQASCGGLLRPKVMLYADPAEGLITPPFDAALAADLAAADVVLWVGISFEQSASVEHFRRARRALQAAGLAGRVPQLVVNPAAEAAFNVATAVANAGELRLMHARATADDFLAALAQLPPAPQPQAARKRRRGARAAVERGDDGDT